MLKAINKQFRKPSGYLGKIIANLMYDKNRPNYEKVIENMEIKSGAKLFEIGYGPGWGLNRIITDFDCTITGIDFSELMYRQASKRNLSHIEKGKIELHYGDFLENDGNFSDFDLVYCVNVVYFWSDLTTAFTKINNVLNENGSFCFYMAGSENLDKLKFIKDTVFNKYSIDDAVKALENAGFQNINYYYEDGYIISAGKK